MDDRYIISDIQLQDLIQSFDESVKILDQIKHRADNRIKMDTLSKQQFLFSAEDKKIAPHKYYCFESLPGVSIKIARKYDKHERIYYYSVFCRGYTPPKTIEVAGQSFEDDDNFHFYGIFKDKYNEEGEIIDNGFNNSIKAFNTLVFCYLVDSDNVDVSSFTSSSVSKKILNNSLFY